MTPEALRIAIAESRGWTCINSSGVVPIGLDPKLVRLGYAAITCLQRLPDYLNDLNAAREMESGLTDANSQQYYDELRAVQRRLFGCVTDWQFQMIHAPAAQRAEAYARTLGIYKETKA